MKNNLGKNGLGNGDFSTPPSGDSDFPFSTPFANGGLSPAEPPPQTGLPYKRRGDIPREIARKIADAIGSEEMFIDATPQEISDRFRILEGVLAKIREQVQMQDDRSRKNYFVHSLTDTNHTITIGEPFVMTSIHRDVETYDQIDTSTNAYDIQKINIEINGSYLFSEDIPVALLPQAGQYSYPLACPYYVSRGSRIHLRGGTGLDNLKIGLAGYSQCFSVVTPPTPHIMVLESHMIVDDAELSVTGDLPTWMFFAHRLIHSAQMFETSENTWDYSAYGNANTNYMQGKLNIPYPHGNRYCLRSDEPARMFAGSRNFPLLMTEEFCVPGNSIQWEKSAATYGSNEWYDYLIIGGYFFGIK